MASVANTDPVAADNTAGNGDGESKQPVAPTLATEAVLVKSVEMPKDAPICKGFDFNKPASLGGLMEAYKFMGFQGTNLGLAAERINEMRRWRLSDDPWVEADGEELKSPEARAKVKATIFFSYTSNMISSGNREVIRFLVQHKMVDVIVTTAGGIEEDFLKCKAPHYMGDFRLKGRDLRLKGLNRIGNLIVPNKNYCLFEDWFAPLLNTMHDEQERDGTIWTPSKMIRRMGKEIDDPESVYYWAYKNDIPVYCPAITDGSVGDMIFFHSYKRDGFILDIARDIRGMNESAMLAKRSGMIILGGGLVKHHVCNANLMRNGADWAVFVNTGQEFDGSDSGARPDEAVSWGKIKIDSRPVKVYADATLVFPMLVAQTFAKAYHAGEYGPVAPVGSSGAGVGAGAGARPSDAETQAATPEE